jgi:hypothetical protein
MDIREMKLDDLKPIFKALADGEVRYLVVGGLAVNVHGLRRATEDLDIVVQLLPDNVERAFKALQTAGYRPNVPVTASQLGDKATREAWIRDKGMKVLNFFSAMHPTTPVDIFVIEPFPFEEEYRQSVIKPIADVDVRFVSLSTLIRMKEKVGRLQDRIDVENLRLRLKDDAKR